MRLCTINKIDYVLETKVNALVNLVMNLCSNSGKLEDASSVLIAKDMGIMLTSLENCLTPQQSDKLLSFYQYLASRGLDNKTITVYSMDTSQVINNQKLIKFVK